MTTQCHFLFLSCVIFLALAGAVRGDDKPKYQDVSAPVESRVDDLLGRMTIEEKIGLIAGVRPSYTVANERLGIPEIIMADGRMGMRTWKTANATVGGIDLLPGTCYPGGIGVSAGWDRDLAARFGRQMARDAQAHGVHIWLGPMVNMYRTPVGGRNFECGGEDPYLVSQMAVAEVKAIQAGGVMATAVIFCGNDQDFGQGKQAINRNTADSIIDERTLREIYYPPFEALAKDAHVGAFMASYNLLNGEHSTQNTHLLRDILKGEWGFSGFVMSDWGATHDTIGAANAGLDLEMPGPDFFNLRLLGPALKSGEVKQDVIDDKVRRILRQFFAFGFLDRPQKDDSIPADDPAGDALALEMARKEIVLLKNEDKILPLDRAKIHSIAILGSNADPAVYSGGGSSYGKPAHAVSVLAGVRATAGSTIQVNAVPWNPSLHSRSLADVIRDSAKAAKASDIAVVCVGFRATGFQDGANIHPETKGLYEGEGEDRTYALPPRQVKLLQAVAAANPHTIVILNAGGGVEWTGWLDKVPALIDAFYPGQEGGRALAEILFGDVNPSGKLPATFEKKWADNPSSRFYDHPQGDKEIYGEGIFTGYRGFDEKGIEPQFSFGFGLSYTRFNYVNLQVEAAKAGDEPHVTVRFDVKNTGSVTGAEIAEVYVADPHASVPRPPRELKGFARIDLAPGESKSVSVDLDGRAFSFYDVKGHAWKFEPGKFTIEVGSSSRRILLQQSVDL